MEQEKNTRTKKRLRSPRQERRRQREEHGKLTTASARLNFLRVAPRKARLVIDQIRGKSVQEAEKILTFSERAVATPINLLLRSAVANADQEGLNVDALKISEAWVNGGPSLKRFMPRAMGRAARILKRTSHITLILREED
jgi:large subunit ribosomal protein L22